MNLVKYIMLSIFFCSAALAYADDANYVRSQCEEKILPKKFKETGSLPFASFEGNIMCLAEGIFPDGVLEAINIMRSNNINKILITSGGGDADASLDLAEEILKRGIDVYVNGPCYSACANYIFLAARKKYILDKSVVAWHGAPGYPKDDSSFSEEAKARIRNTVSRHLAFFSKIGVDPDLPYKVPCDLKKDTEFMDADRDTNSMGNVFWTYPREILENRFGVQGIMQMWEPDNAHSLRKIFWREKVFLANGCG